MPPLSMHVTLSARSKILKIVEPGKAFRIQATGNSSDGNHVDLIPDADVTAFDSTISTIPKIIVDIHTATLLAGQSFDFDYGTEEFIISKKGTE